MSYRVVTVHDDFYKLERAIKTLSEHTVNVGVLGGGENAFLAAIHEYGLKIAITPKMRKWLHANGLHVRKDTSHIVIPERAFLRNGFDTNHKQIIDGMERVLEKVLGGTISGEVYLEAIGEQLATAIKEYAVELRSPANHPFTIDRKGSSNPLVSTGGMIESITYEVK